MNGWLALLGESTAIAAGVAAGVSVLSWHLLARVDRDQTAPARRADLALLAGSLPMLSALAVLVALVLPSLLHTSGIQADHCGIHSHHRHLCAVHGAIPQAGLLLVGAAAAALWMVRAGRLALAHRRAHRALSALQRLGQRTNLGRFPRVLVPGSPWLSVAVGVLRPRVVLSASLESHLAPEALEAVLAHEEAHLVRHDPRAMSFLAWAGLFGVPGVSGKVRDAFHEASEEAADANAADEVGPHAVAAALVAVARLAPGRPPAFALGFGDTAVQRRVHILLQGHRLGDRSLAPRLLLLVVAATALIAIGGSEWIHHAVESLLQ